METLEFIITHKSFNYQNDAVRVEGTVSVGIKDVCNFTGTVYKKVEENDEEYTGSFSFTKDGVRKLINISDTEMHNVSVISAAAEALLAKFIADGVIPEEEPEVLAES